MDILIIFSTIAGGGVVAAIAVAVDQAARADAWRAIAEARRCDREREHHRREREN